MAQYREGFDRISYYEIYDYKDLAQKISTDPLTSEGITQFLEANRIDYELDSDSTNSEGWGEPVAPGHFRIGIGSSTQDQREITWLHELGPLIYRAGGTFRQPHYNYMESLLESEATRFREDHPQFVQEAYLKYVR